MAFDQAYRKLEEEFRQRVNAKNPSNPVRRATNAVPGVTPPSLLAAAPWSAPPASPDSS